MILQIIGTAQVFLEPFLFTSGGPANSTLTVLLLIYDYAFGNSLGGDYGAATALSLMLAGFLALFSLVYLRAHSLLEHAMIRLRLSAAAPRRRGDPAGSDLAGRMAPPGDQVGRRGRARAPPRRGWSSSGSARLLWLAKSAITPTNDTITPPDGALPARHGLEQPARGVVDVHVGRYFWNTVVLAFGSWLVADHRRDDRRLRALGAAARVREADHALLLTTLFVRRSCCSCRCTSRSCTRR